MKFLIRNNQSKNSFRKLSTFIRFLVACSSCRYFVDHAEFWHGADADDAGTGTKNSLSQLSRMASLGPARYWYEVMTYFTAGTSFLILVLHGPAKQVLVDCEQTSGSLKP